MILPLEKQVSSLELSKRLKELGVKKKDSLFYWEKYSFGEWQIVPGDWVEVDWAHIPEGHAVRISAFTSSELGEILRSLTAQMQNIVIRDHRERIRRLMSRINRSWQNPDEVNDRAKLLIYLLENKLITL